jgi:hypothetical protein
VQPAGGALHEQAPEPAAPEHVWLTPQLVLPFEKMQCWEEPSSAQVVNAEPVPLQVVPATPEHSAGVGRQVQAADGFEPVQVWCAGHAAGATAKTHWVVASTAHVPSDAPVQ